MTITVGDDGNASSKDSERLDEDWRPAQPNVVRDFPALLDGLARGSGCDRINFLCD